MPAPQPAPDCLSCRHHFVTWEAARPHGCRAFGIRCAALPARVVLLAGGQPCGLFEARSQAPPHQGTAAPV